MSGGGKETTRQKMISLMYLVLLAMLAMNVSAEVLNAFGLFEERLSETLRVLNEKNDLTETIFRQALKENQQRVQSWFDKALKVREISKEMALYVEDIKVELVKIGDGEDATAVENNKVKGENIINIASTDPSSDLLVRRGKGLELKEKIAEYKNSILSYVNPKAKDLIASVEKTLETASVKSKEGGLEKEWEVATFSDIPLIAAVPLLTKIQGDILTCEADVMAHLLSQVDVGTVKIDNFDPVVQSSSDYVLRGGTFDAKIFLAASDKSLQPTVVVNGKTLKTVNGKAEFTAPANALGEQTLKGVITLNGKPYPFTYNYMVAEPSVVVSPTKMNVLYRGVPNPVDISAAGIPNNKVRINVSNGALSKSGANYVIVPGEGNTCDVSISAEVNGAVTNMGKKTFRVKSVPVPLPEMDGVTGKTASRQQLSASQGIRAVMPRDFDFDLKFTIRSFVVFASIDGYVREEMATGLMFTEKQKQIMRKLAPGQRLSITDIKAAGPDGKVVELPDLSIKVR
ncbi:MAG: gliding motility protein GldM [Bacteroidales bacterium]